MCKKTKLLIAQLMIAALLCAVIVLSFSACGPELKLSFIVDGEVYAVVETTGNEKVSVPENPVKEGYVFEGWYWDKDVWEKPFTVNSLLDTPITSDMCVYARFESAEATPDNRIIYQLGGGNNAQANPDTYAGGAAVALQNPTWAGYDFLGWYLNGAMVTEIPADATGSITLEARWEATEYEITYQGLENGTHANRDDFTVESGAIVLTDATRPGYTFDGWYLDGENVTEIARGTIGNISLEAKWTAKEYTITYEGVYGETNPNASVFTILSETITLENVSRTGYSFVGWFNGETEVTSIPAGTIGDITLTAKWEKHDFTISYHKMGNATHENPGSYDMTDEAIVLADASREGYTFCGWYMDGVRVTEIPAGTSGNLNIEAAWELVNYTITYDGLENAVSENVATYHIESGKIVLNGATKVGYAFLGWYADDTLVTEIAAGSTGDIALTAKWRVIDYYITYSNVNGATHENRLTYNVETADLALSDAEKDMNLFDGWFIDGVLVDSIPAGMTGNIVVEARWKPIEFTITYEGITGVNEELFTTYIPGTDHVALNAVTRRGYIFDGWYMDDALVTEIPTDAKGDLVIKAKWVIIRYNITYTEIDGAENYNVPEYDVESGKIVFNEPTKRGYRFTGWYQGEDLVTELSAGSIGDMTLSATWELIDYYITYSNTKDAENVNQETYTVETKDFAFEPISKPGYIFDGWYLNGELVTGMQAGSVGNIVIEAKWTLIEYTITFEGTDGAIHENVNSFNVESDKIVLSDASKIGYTFDGWFVDGVLVTEIPAGSIGDITIKAEWTVVVYNITFEGVEGAENDNVPTYTIEDDRIVLNDAVKPGYTFDGWFVNGELKTEIPTGSYGDITIKAEWTVIVYNITFEGMEGANNFNTNFTYTIESDTIVFEKATKYGYIFDGWFIGDELVTEIPAGSYGNVVIKAHFTAIIYNITFNGIEGAENDNVPTYTIESDRIILNDAVKPGYTFNGWYDGEKYVTEIPTGTVGHITVEAKWTINIYNITYNGIEGATNNNVPTFTVEDDTIVLNDAVKPGYTFNGWYVNGQLTTEIPAGTIGNITIEAKFTVIIYNITFNGVEGATNNNVPTFTIEDDTIVLNDAVKPGYTFNGWYINGQLTTEIPAGTIGNIIIEATWTVNIYNITYNGIEGATNNNIPTFTVESDRIVLNDAVKPGYTFDGWYDGEKYITEIPTGTIGHITIEAKFTVIVYNITFNGVSGATNNNVPTFTVESDRIVLNDAVKPGYTFNGWYVGGNSITEIPAGTIGDIVIRAEWTINIYNITYNGVEGATNSNVPTFTVEDRVILAEPEMENRYFEGWYINGVKVTEIPVGTYNHLVIEARWTVDISGAVFKANTDYNLNNSLPVDGVLITITGNGVNKQFTTGEDGKFAFAKLPLGTYTMTFVKEGFIRLEITIGMDVHTLKNIYMDIDQSSKVTGTVLKADADTNLSNNSVIPGALVTLKKYSGTNELILTTTTDSNGKYAFTNLTAGIYVISITKDGYLPVEQYVKVEERAVTVQNMMLEIIPETTTAVGGASGTILDAGQQGNVGVSNLTLEVREGVNNITVGEIVATFTTGTNGAYQIDGLIPGNYTVLIVDNRELSDESLRYNTSYFNIKILPGTTVSNQNGSVFRGANIGDLKIVLAWGSSPKDLDSHITGPTGNGGRYHVYYSSKSSNGAALDRDDTDSYGPETITVDTSTPGIYRYSVHNYSNKGSSNSTTMASSGATVTVYVGGQLMYTFYVPEGVGTLWTVFEYDSTTGIITPINTMSNQSEPSSIS